MKLTTVRLWLLVLMGAIFFATPSVAAAQEVQPNDTVASLELSALTVTAIVSLFIPIVVGLVTKADLNSLWKGAINIILSAVNAAVVTATVADGTAVFSKETLIAAFFGMVISLATYLQIYQKVDLNSKLLPNKGI
jgi:small basic protein